MRLPRRRRSVVSVSSTVPEPAAAHPIRPSTLGVRRRSWRAIRRTERHARRDGAARADDARRGGVPAVGADRSARAVLGADRPDRGALLGRAAAGRSTRWSTASAASARRRSRRSTAELLASSNVLVARATCDSGDDFTSIWRKALGEIALHSESRGIGFASSTTDVAQPASVVLGDARVTPHAVVRARSRRWSAAAARDLPRRVRPARQRRRAGRSSPTRSRRSPTASCRRRSCSSASRTRSTS